MGICRWESAPQSGRARLLSPAPDALKQFVTVAVGWRRHIYPTDLHLYDSKLSQAVAGKERPTPFDYRLVTEDAGIVWVRHWLLAPKVHRSSSRNKKLQGFIQLVSREKELEAEGLRICEHERHTMGQELHDDVCQLLAGLACMLEMFGRQVETAMPQSAPALRELVCELNDGMARTRSLAQGLVPLRLADLGLARAFRELARQAETRWAVSVKTRFSPRLGSHDPAQILQLYRIAQEAMGNAIKHGKATKISVELRKTGSRMQLRVQDNGVGLPDKSTRAEGLGLHIMNHRASALGGDFRVQSKRGAGALVTVSYRLHRPSSRNQIAA